MDQNIDNRHKEILWDLLANPAETGQLYKHNLEQLVQDNPQSGLLQVMYARATQTPDIRKAAVYFSPKALYKILHDPDGLLPVARERVNKAHDGSSASESENYFNIGVVTEAEAEDAEVISDAPVAEAESLVTRDFGRPLDYLAPIEASASQAEEQQLLPEHGEENTFTALGEEFVADATPAVPEAEAEQTYYQEPPPDSYYIPATQPQAASQAAPLYDEDEDDEFANPWDLSKLEEPDEPAVGEQVAKDTPVAEQLPEHDADILPEQEVETAREVQSRTATDPVTTPVVKVPYIETYDHSLSAFEQHAVTAADSSAAALGEVSSFESYRPEYVFHKQGDIEDDVYDEIVSIDEISLETVSNKFAEDIHPEEIELEANEPNQEATNTQQNYIDDETEKLIYGNIAATDYLSFDKKLDELRAGIQPPVEVQEPGSETAAAVEPLAPLPLPIPAAQTQITEGAKEPEAVSKYDDDTLPYSFMWWLDKTRKEYAGVNQPYATPGQADAPQPEQSGLGKRPVHDQLQQQYYSNIFSLTSVSSIGDIEPPQIAFDPEKKEDIIIERFIHTDPQIKPLSADKLDNENKAKKSSEDQDAIVTETLARIYGDQMLYHKAIATYKKLMLKIPEKKLYFAAQIEQLEKKIN